MKGKAMKSETSTTQLYCGMDLHSNNVYCAIIDQSGARRANKRLPLDIERIIDYLKPYRGKLKETAVESTYNWYWLVDSLQEEGFNVRLANPAKMTQYSGIKQTDDKSDAFWIAKMLQLGILPQGYIYPKQLRPVRDMLRRRCLVKQQRTQTLLTLQSMIARNKAKTVSGTKLKRWTKKEVEACFGDPHLQQTASSLLDLISKQDDVIEYFGTQAQAMVKLSGSYQRLLTAPGIGTVLGLTIMLETGPVERFKNAGCYASYCRAVNSCCKSNDKKKGGNNKKNGNKYLAWAFVEAANHAQQHYPQIRRWFDKKKAATNRTVAVKSLACKLSKAVYYILRDDMEFDMQKMFG